MRKRATLIGLLLVVALAAAGVIALFDQPSNVEQIRRAHLEYVRGYQERDADRVCAVVSDSYMRDLTRRADNPAARSCATVVEATRGYYSALSPRFDLRVVKVRIDGATGLSELLIDERCLVHTPAIWIKEDGEWRLDDFIAGTQEPPPCFSREIGRKIR